MAIEFTMIQSIGIAVVLLLLGIWLKQRIYFFERFAIPAPVIGGFLFALINLVLHQTGIAEITFDTTLQSFFMVIFFTTVGYGASLKVLRAAGPKVMVFLVVAIVLTILQNVVAVGLAPIVGVDAKLALMTGSVSMTGGHGVSGGIAPLVEQSGVSGAETVAYTAATFGLIMGSLMGGPLANRLITKGNLMDQKAAKVDIDESLIAHVARKLRGDAMLHAFVMILVSMLIGSFVTDAMNHFVGMLTDKAAFPLYFGSMIVAIILRFINDSREQKEYKELVPTQEVEILGVIGLNFFLAMALMNIKLWELAELAVPMLILLVGQTALMWLFANFVTFRVMGRDYDAAVLTAGHCGFGMGATPNGMANMDSVVTKFKESKLAFFILPIIGGMFIDFANIVNILVFLNIA
ncbi:sodium/glutamate symporter [Corynebacterium simulans]|uniref:sodium/glutamate symporter n=1 Tax=Corynebacterium TaxID=1716 RepID=UPI00078D36D5|nr:MULTISPECIES: sodium/glutamate symporter [Corynebacterium]AMO89423.1 sodium/glutamate symporter [Corynebacterium simulans]MCG7247938.1 sodium/glutamate symporter [Corynebacterium simulans]MDK7138874.1 sodium/glutamate symporter [Corynebacterium simulans]